MTQKSSLRKHDRKAVPLLIVGVVLILLGIVTAKALSNGNASEEFSVVPIKVNFTAPDLTLNDLDGNQVNLADYRQNIVLVNNWATWCPPCKAEMPTLLDYFKAHSGEGFVLIGIEAGDPINEVRQFIDQYDLTFPILLDPNNLALIAFRNDGLPSSYVIDHSGNVILAWTGPISREMLEKYITPLLGQ